MKPRFRIIYRIISVDINILAIRYGGATFIPKNEGAESLLINFWTNHHRFIN